MLCALIHMFTAAVVHDSRCCHSIFLWLDLSQLAEHPIWFAQHACGPLYEVLQMYVWFPNAGCDSNEHTGSVSE